MLPGPFTEWGPRKGEEGRERNEGREGEKEGRKEGEREGRRGGGWTPPVFETWLRPASPINYFITQYRCAFIHFEFCEINSVSIVNLDVLIE